MNNIVIHSKKLNEADLKYSTNIYLDKSNISIGIVDQPIPDFNTLERNNFVLVKKDAFSLNYRDRAIINYFWQVIFQTSTVDKPILCPVGSDFVGRIINVGSNVKDLKIGDRVIPIAQYPESLSPNLKPGLPTNYASKRFEVFHKDYLLKIQNDIPDEVAASLTVAGHTVYSMVENAKLSKGKNVLITALKSNTSLALLAALGESGCNIFGITSSHKFNETFKKLGVTEIINYRELPQNSINEIQQIEDILKKINGFDVVFDPFADLHLSKVVDCMNYNSKYITCGSWVAQNRSGQPGITDNEKMDDKILPYLILKNIHIIGNCLGHKRHLVKAIQEYLSGKFNFPIDSIITGNDIAYFFDRTFNDPERFGKVVYKYTD